MTGAYQQRRELRMHQRGEERATHKRMQFTAQDLADLQEALASFAAQPLDEEKAARIRALLLRIESSAAVLVKRSITETGHGLIAHIGPGAGWVIFAEPPAPLKDTIPF